jgi:hypothetical protein
MSGNTATEDEFEPGSGGGGGFAKPATEDEFEPGSGGGGGFAKPNAEKTKLELEEERLKELLAEKDRFAGCHPNNVEYLYVLSQIERCKAKISILSRVTPSKPVDTSAEVGMCMLCYEEKSDPDKLEGCHTEFCLLCFDEMMKAKPINVRPRGYDSGPIRLNAIQCPLCRDVIANNSDILNLKLARIYIKFKKLRTEIDCLIRQASLIDDIPLMSDLQDQLAQLILEEQRETSIVIHEINEEKRVREAEERRRREEAARIEHERNSRLNLEKRQEIIKRAQDRENLRCMISRGEALPPGTILTPIPQRLNCCTTCRVPRMIVSDQATYAEFRADVIVNESTSCTICHNFLFNTWEQQAIDAFRAEEERRVDDLYQAALVDQERHEQVTAALNRRAFLFAEVSELERPLREQLRIDLLAAGENERAREKAQAKFDRNLEEAQRKWNRKHRS